MSSNETSPLLQHNDRGAPLSSTGQGFLTKASPFTESRFDATRKRARRFLSSRYGHYAVLLLVSLDVSCIFADFLISLYICEHSCGQGQGVKKELPEVQEALGIVSLVFSCLFMVELLTSIWAFGFQYFQSWFHCFDATVILAGFIIDVCLKGVLEEAGSIVVVLRLWRVFKIVEEFSAGASEQMDTLVEEMEKIQKENEELKRQLDATRPHRIVE